MQYDFFGHVSDWHQHPHHVIPMASSMTPLHLFSQGNQNEVQHDFFGIVMHLVLALASCNVDGIVHGTTAFVSSRGSK